MAWIRLKLLDAGVLDYPDNPSQQCVEVYQQDCPSGCRSLPPDVTAELLFTVCTPCTPVEFCDPRVLPDFFINYVGLGGLVTTLDDLTNDPPFDTVLLDYGSTFILPPPTVVPTGACCNTLAGGCTGEVIASECSGAHRNWTEGARCADVPCNAVSGACCGQAPFGGCSETSQADCTCDQCVWHKLLTCADIECPHNPIPTTSEWGLVVMALLLLTGAKVYFARRSEMGSP